jgi:hypothetical protein
MTRSHGRILRIKSSDNAIKWVVSPEGKAFAAKEGKPMKMSKEVKNAKQTRIN